MNIESQLRIIAENVPKVYEAGRAAGGSTAPTGTVLLVDTETSKTYTLYVSNGKLMMAESEA